MQSVVSAVVNWRSAISSTVFCRNFMSFQIVVMSVMTNLSLTVRSCLHWITELTTIDQILPVYFTAVAFLHVCYKITRNSLSDELLDVLATLCLQANDTRRCLNARHSSVLSLRQATALMKVVTTNSRTTVQLIEIELAKAYLHRALRCKDNDIDSIYCLANMYLAVLNYTTGKYQTATDHCTLVMRSRDHSQCRSHVVQGELLPKIDDAVDVASGLAVFSQYIQTSALNQQQRTQNITVFTTELFAHYLRNICLSAKQYHTSSTDGMWRYGKYFRESTEISDVLLFRSVNCTKYPENCQRLTVVREFAEPVTASNLDTSKLVQLLQQSAVEHLTTFRQLEAQQYGPVRVFVTTEFEALYAYKCGEYQRCLRLASDAVQTLIGAHPQTVEELPALPQLIQLIDDDVVSLIGLTVIIDPSRGVTERHVSISQLTLCLYLMTQCQIKLNHPVASLAVTLDFIANANAYLYPDSVLLTLNQLILKLIERKIKMRVGRSAFGGPGSRSQQST